MKAVNIKNDIPKFFMRIRKIDEFYHLESGELIKGIDGRLFFDVLNPYDTVQKRTRKVIESIYARRLAKINRIWFSIIKYSYSSEEVIETAVILPYSFEEIFQNL